MHRLSVDFAEAALNGTVSAFIPEGAKLVVDQLVVLIDDEGNTANATTATRRWP